MSRIRRRGTSAELTVGILLRTLGVSYRKGVRTLPGTPDFANRSAGWAIFVNGCFWHRHTGCRRATIPKANRAFWETKLRRNRARDAATIKALRARGLIVAVVWECELKTAQPRLAKFFDRARRRTAPRGRMKVEI